MNHAAISPEQSRWARRLLGLSQKSVAQQAGISLAYLKLFELGRFNPSEDFHRRLSEFFASKEVDLAEFDDSEIVDPAPAQPGKPRKVRRMGLYLCDALSTDNVQRWFERIEENQAEIAELLKAKVVPGTWGGDSAETEEQLKHLYSRFVLEALMLRALLGNNPVQPKPLGDAKAEILADYLADFLASNLDTESSSTESEAAA